MAVLALLGTILVAVFVGYLLLNEVWRTNVRVKGIPGPQGLPLVGNLHQIRGRNAAEVYRKWAKKFGSVYQIQLGNVPVIIVSSVKAAREIFIGQGSALISRPMFYTFHKVPFSIGTSPWDESAKRRRKAASTALNRPAVQSYIPFLDLETKDFITDLYERGFKGERAVDCMPMVQRLSLNMSLTLNYGTRISSIDDALFEEITEVEEWISKFRSTTGNLQDYIPLVRLNPLNAHSKLASEMRDRRDIYLTRLNRELQERIGNGTDKPCIQGNVLKDPEAQLDEKELMSISITMISGGLDTITTTLGWIVGFLARHPEVQEKAFQEIISAYDTDFWGDETEEKIPYITAFVKETLRYFTVLRLALPRESFKDIEYEGMKIPKGTCVFLNAWGCNRDDEAFEDPFEFRPERFLTESSGTAHFAYGAGTRMCAGSLLANRELYIVFMRMLWAFKIELSEDPKERDFNIDPVEGSVDPTSLVTLPPRFKVRFVPRNEHYLLKLIKKG
ncbi:3-hydroxyphenylacetate 6-hydroxylase [Neolecta irregularis DAH-3]|uniref:3-hydroxyphenylacetate 6-hydroxylase n=1 Tax=Neolecta irregularis (strain DAH-3) TaxID=1198029 RepID=A0A1U7LUE8_NEOID|nr:3-hydroxyphenylacetate 6-hydroxylase [Neolecta irregularis DAH-3]|eukprot:OLL26238.1 3-hydroxyphenylacetate 6-hydroxylase [Neolecta irregularis DAH-3]